MSKSELEEKFGQLAGSAYLKGTSAEDILSALDTARERVKTLDGRTE